MKIAPWMVRNTMNIIVPLLYAPLLSGPHLQIDIMFADDHNVAETMTCHQSRYIGSWPFAVVQARGVTVLRVRLAFAAAHCLMCGQPNRLNKF
jgi:hypothetical protein